MFETHAVVFTTDELWLMRSVVRHDASQPWQGKWPGYSLELNDSIAEALLFCLEDAVTEAALLLTKGDLYLLDFCVPQDAKSPGGVMLGKSILLKTFKARRVLAGDPQATEPEPEPVADLDEKLEQWKGEEERLALWKKKRRPSRAKEKQSA